MSSRKFNYDAMSALGLGRELADIFNNTFFTVATVTAAANGNANVAHGLGATPTFYAAGIAGQDTVHHCDIESVGATNIVVRIKSGVDGTDITSGNFNIWVIASTKL